VNTYTDYPIGRDGLPSHIISRCTFLGYVSRDHVAVIVSGRICTMPKWRLYMGERYNDLSYINDSDTVPFRGILE
jgi:hypothetical protein